MVAHSVRGIAVALTTAAWFRGLQLGVATLHGARGGGLHVSGRWLCAALGGGRGAELVQLASLLVYSSWTLGSCVLVWLAECAARGVCTGDVYAHVESKALVL